jgi:cyclic pyranopterin phosphate synthase
MRLPVVETSSPALPVGGANAHFDTGPRSIGAVRVLRISVTDRCNFRCVYCMPADGVKWLPKDDLLSFEEIVEISRAAIDVHGIRRFKLTGGEPTVRHNLVDLVSMMRRLPGIEDLSLTTNGFALTDLAQPLREAGLDRITVSLDSLHADRFKRITRTGDLDTVMRGIERAIDVGFSSIKINCVTMRGTNDDELAAFAKLALRWPVTVRFIEYMPLGDSALLESGNPFVETRDSTGNVNYDTTKVANPRVAEDEIGPSGGCGAQVRGDVFVDETFARSAIEAELGPLVPIDRTREAGVGPAVPYGFADHPAAPGRVGFISAMSAPFCATCNRLRLTATGVLRSCLFEGGEVDLKPILRADGAVASNRPQRIAQAMTDCVRLKPDVHSVRGNEQMSRLGG